MKEIPLTQGKVALVDDEDYERVALFRWVVQSFKNSGLLYAKRMEWTGWNAEMCRPIRKTFFMHRMIMGDPKGMVVDHIDSNGLNNAKTNLRVCTNKQNLWNMRVRKDTGSGYKGVGFHKQSGRWVARIVADGRNYSLGLHETKEKAAMAYDRAAVRHFGKFARLNFPDQFTTWYEAKNEATV